MSKQGKRTYDRGYVNAISVLFFAAIMVCFFIMTLFENLGIIR